VLSETIESLLSFRYSWACHRATGSRGQKFRKTSVRSDACVYTFCRLKY